MRSTRHFRYTLENNAPGPSTAIVEQPVAAPSAPPAPNREARRKQKAFNRRLSHALEKDGTPARVEVLPDGGIHIHVDKT